MKLGRVALDGTKLKANASKHKAMSYERMKEQEQRIAEQVREMLAKAEATDAEEDERYGKDNTGDELPEELQRRETRLQRIREAMKALEERAKAEAEAGGKQAAEAEPKAKAQHNFTDPESRIMKSKEGFVQAYNAQIAVEPDFQLIVGQAVTQAGNDKQQVVPMMEAVEEQSGQRPASVLADSGYCSDENLAYLASEENPENRIEAYIATGRQKHGEQRVCPRGPLPAMATRVDRMTRKLQTKAGAAIYAARKAIVEPVFGQIKEARGFRRFSLRGLEKVRAEWALVCATHNILKIYRLCQA
jgi:hypothetical protein